MNAVKRLFQTSSKLEALFEGEMWRGKANKLLGAYGHFIAKHPWHFLLIPIIVSLTLASGMVFYRMNNDISYLYTPTNSPSRREIEVFNTFHLPTKDAEKMRSSGEAFQGVKIDAATGDFAIAIIYESHSAELNFLRNQQPIFDFDSFIKQDFVYLFEKKWYRFSDTLCTKFTSRCVDSLVNFKQFMQMYREFQGWLQFSYPIFDGIFGQKFNIGNLFHGVTFVPDTNVMKSVAVVQSYIAINETNSTAELEHWKAFKAGLIREVTRRNSYDKNMTIHVFSPEMLNQEVDKIQAHTLPYVALTFMIIFMFAIVSNLDSANNWTASYCWEAVGGIAASLLSLPPTFGLLFICGAIFNGSVTMTPFLVLAIGIDDTFIMLGAWRKTSGIGKIEERLAEVMREVGAAIFLTSITDVASFSIGAFATKTPAMIAFCQFTAVGIGIDFLLQLTFFPAILVFGGQREAKGYHGLFLRKNKKELKKYTIQAKNRETRCGSRICRLFLDFLRSKIGKVWAIAGYGAYLMIALYGSTCAVVDLKVDQLLADDSELSPYLKLMNSVIWAESVKVEVFVERPPDFREQYYEDLFLNFTQTLESTPYSTGPSSTVFWLRDYKNFREKTTYPMNKYYLGLQHFMQEQDAIEDKYVYWKKDYSIFGNKTIEKFKFDLYFSNLTSWADRIELLKILRAEYGKMKQFNVVIHTPNSFSSDQVSTLGSSTMQTVGVALLVMGTIALLFFPQVQAIFWVFLALLSIDLGVVGFLFLWGSDLDPMTMTNIVLSIGFSIDFSAHFCFQFYRFRKRILSQGRNKALLLNQELPPLSSDSKTGPHYPTTETFTSDNSGRTSIILPRERTKRKMEPAEVRNSVDVGVEVLETIGWPLLQCGLSTILAVLPLALVPAYLVRNFFKTVFLAVGFGLMHALVLLPTILSALCVNHGAESRKQSMK